MSIATILIMCAAILAVTAATVIAVKRQNSRVRDITTTPEERALMQARSLGERVSAASPAQYRRSAQRYFKRLKTIMVVYFKERYDITVRDTIDAGTMSLLTQRFSAKREILEKHRDLFTEMEQVKQAGLDQSAMHLLCEKSVALLETA
ncbi:MAG: hypothetical protein GF418_16320 [Chitinivibrionales bacterium]|nr:hypothetical protein [Chitinivibrionales bacterium]MBD3397187.1 hypothetical protein [Chitinivibrionales bacterium]